MSRRLRIGPGLELPQEAVTQTFAILAKRGAGKTYAALVLAEELLKLEAQVVIADPVGVCWGLRAAANGNDPGLPIVVMGGDHGDVPLEATAGKVIAEFVVETRQSVVLDLSLLRKGDQVRFMTDFAETLYHRNRAPLHLILDEADAFAPQRVFHGQERMLGAMQDLVRRGRARGIGVTLVTQRAAVLSKDVLTQVEVLIALRTIAPQDREAIDAWIQAHDAHGQRAEFMASLASLPIGTAWFWSPGWLDLFKRVKVRARETFDSSATPAIGSKPKDPAKLAPVDLEQLKKRIGATIERAKQEDPRELRRRIAELERAAQRKGAAFQQRGSRVEVPILKDVQIKRLERVVGRVESAMAQLGQWAAAFTGTEREIRNAMAEIVTAIRQAIIPKPVPGGPRPAELNDAAPLSGRRLPNAGVLEAPPQRILDTIAMLALRGLPATREAVARWQGIHPNGGRYNRSLAVLRESGYLEGFRLTAAGQQLARAMDTGTEAAVAAQPDEAQRRVLVEILKAHPQALTKEDLAGRLEIHPNGGRFNHTLAWLRDMGIIPERGPIIAVEGVFR